MLCPVCNVDLQEIGVELRLIIVQCRGVWLDRESLTNYRTVSYIANFN